MCCFVSRLLLQFDVLRGLPFPATVPWPVLIKRPTAEAQLGNRERQPAGFQIGIGFPDLSGAAPNRWGLAMSWGGGWGLAWRRGSSGHMPASTKEQLSSCASSRAAAEGGGYLQSAACVRTWEPGGKRSGGFSAKDGVFPPASALASPFFRVPSRGAFVAPDRRKAVLATVGWFCPLGAS